MKDRHTRTQNLESAILQLVNQERQKHKSPPLTGKSNLSEIAVHHSLEMLHSNNIYHDSPKTGSVGDRVKRAGLPFIAVAENVAMGGDLNGCHAGLMNSKGHRKNILNKSYTHVGMGIVRNQEGMLFITQVFLEELSVLDIAVEKQKAIQEINALRSKKQLPAISPIELVASNRLTSKIGKSSTFQLKQLKVDPTINQIGKELQVKKIPYRRLSITWKTGKTVDVNLVKKQMLNPKLKTYALDLTINKQLGCLCMVFVFIEGS